LTSTTLDTHSPAALAIRPGQQMWNEKQQAALAVLGIKGASNADLAVFMHVCQNTGLDPFTRQIHGIMRREKVTEYSNGQKTETWVDKFTIQVGIDGFRVIRDRIADRKGLRVEYEDTVWYDADGNGRDVWLWDEPPAACRVVVLVDGRRFPSVLKFTEYCQYSKDGKNPVAQWASKPAHMIEKCAEANGLRRAFPNDMAGIRLEDEMPPPEVNSNGDGNGSARPRGRVTVAEVIDRRTEDSSGPAPSGQPAGQEPAAGPEEAPEGQPGSASHDQLTRLHTILTRLGFNGEDREQKLVIAEVITGRSPLTGPAPGRSSKNLSFTEARKLIDTLDGFGDRDALIAFMAERQQAGDGDA
jgi:phage recombination protein Bet